MSSFNWEAFFLYLALIIGAAVTGIYFGLVLTAPFISYLHYITTLEGAGFVVFTLLISHSHSRRNRTLLTVVSGAFAGIQGYLNQVLFPGVTGFILFFILLLGLAFTFAGYHWIREREL